MEYSLIRTKRRTLSVEVRDGNVIVRAPLRYPTSGIELFLAQKEAWILNAIEKQRLHAIHHPEPTPDEKRELIMRAKSELPPLVEKWSAILGLHPTAITITGAEKRFGSCSGTNRLCFSWRLMRYPQVAIEYVVVHELAHIRHKNHGRDFYRLIESVLPNYRDAEKLLKE